MPSPHSHILRNVTFLGTAFEKDTASPLLDLGIPSSWTFTNARKNPRALLPRYWTPPCATTPTPTPTVSLIFTPDPTPASAKLTNTATPTPTAATVTITDTQNAVLTPIFTACVCSCLFVLLILYSSLLSLPLSRMFAKGWNGDLTLLATISRAHLSTLGHEAHGCERR